MAASIALSNGKATPACRALLMCTGFDFLGGNVMTDLEILARIVQCEAGGEGEQGMKAVACVVMNRVHVDYGEYGRLARRSER